MGQSDAEIESKIAEFFKYRSGVPHKLIYNLGGTCALSDKDWRALGNSLGTGILSIKRSSHSLGKYRLIVTAPTRAPAKVTLADGRVCRITQAGGVGDHDFIAFPPED